MSTRAQIAIEVGPGEWAHVYVSVVAARCARRI
jgi:hypothetical protein